MTFFSPGRQTTPPEGKGVILNVWHSYLLLTTMDIKHCQWLGVQAGISLKNLIVVVFPVKIK